MVANRTRRTPSRPAFKQEFVVAQQSVGEYIDGVYVPGGTTPVTRCGSGQPTDGELVNQLAEAERQTDSMTWWTNGIDAAGDLIKIKSVAFGTEQAQGDIIIYDGLNWNVRRVWDYNVHGHQQILVVKAEAQDG